MGSTKLKKVLFVLTLTLLLPLGGVIFEQYERTKLEEQLPYPGQIVDMPWGQTHIHCLGTQNNAEVTIILESGLDLYGSMSWAPIQESLSREFRVCAYDRPGIMWSDPSTSSKDAETLAAQLNDLLKQTGEAPPFLLVGHSLGGLMMQVYAASYPDQVQGIVLIDSSHAEQASRLPPEALALEMSGMPPNWVVELASAIGALRVFNPVPERPVHRDVKPALALSSTSLVGLVAEAHMMPEIASQAGRAVLPSRTPITVLSRTQEPEGLDQFLSSDVIAEVASIWAELQKELAQLSECGQQHFIPDASHYLHHDQPAIVSDWIVQAASPNTRCPQISH